MRKKYFFFDIDRTLGLDISQIIPADTVYCLNRLRQLGHSVAIATGRLQCDGFRTANRYGITSLVSDGGNSLTMNNELIEMNSLPTANCRALLHELERRHLPWAVFTSNTMVRYTPYELFRHLGQSQLFQTVVTPVDIDALTTIYKIVHVRKRMTCHWIRTVFPAFLTSPTPIWWNRPIKVPVSAGSWNTPGRPWKMSSCSVTD